MIRQFILFSLATVFALQASLVSAQPFPARTVKIIVSTARGGAPDVIARLIAEKLSTFRVMIEEGKHVAHNRPYSYRPQSTDWMAAQLKVRAK